MRALFRQQGANLDISILASDDAQQFIEAHASTLDSSFSQVPMSEAMRRRLQRSDYIFSGIKTFHELNEAFPSLLDENGNRRPFEQFLNDVRKIDQTYNENYLRSEFEFAQASAEMAAKWETFMEDGDRYNLQYRTAGDDRVRPTHAALEGVTLPPSDPFWESYLPPNGWGCRCTTVQVRKKKYPETPHDEAMERGAEALQDDTKGMFRFNAGKEQKTFPDYNPYTISRCRDCDIAKGKLNLAYVPENQLCDACSLLYRLQDTERGRRLTRAERYQTRSAAMQWASAHLQEERLSDTQTAKRLHITNHESGHDLILSRTFFEETFHRNLHNRRLAETMQLATQIEEWLPTASLVDAAEPGIDHDFTFSVYKAVLEGGVTIICKAKNTEGRILYNMRIIE